MTSSEHAEILVASRNFYDCAIDAVRRELVCYGAIISNLANQAQEQRMEIVIVSRALITAVASSNEDSTTDTSIPPTTEPSTTKATKATKPTKEKPEGDITLAGARPDPSEAATLAKSWLKFIEAHECLCEKCSPHYHDVLKSTMVEDGKALWEQEVTKETLTEIKKELMVAYRQEIESSANEEARATYETIKASATAKKPICSTIDICIYY